MLKQLMLRKKLETAKAAVEAHINTRDALTERENALIQRKDEAAAAIDELTASATEEERNAVDAEIEAIETEEAQITADIEAYDAELERLNAVVSQIEADITALDEKTRATGPVAKTRTAEERTVTSYMGRRTFFGMTMEQRDAFLAREDVKAFLAEIRSIKTRGVTNGNLAIPDVMLEVLRENIETYSKLISKVSLKRIGGTARQNVMGKVPEAIWTEATGALNELNLNLTQITLDGYMIGGYIAIPNAILEDGTAPELASEIMTSLGKAIGKGIDRAILYGTGSAMPVGIVTRLSAAAQPAWWGTQQGAFTALNTSHVLTLDGDTASGAAFYETLVKGLAVASPDYSDGKPTWVMSRATHLKLMAKALAFNAATLVTAGTSEMPVIGGEIIELELEELQDDTIIGGYFSTYILGERAGMSIAPSEHVKFVENQTVFKGLARYDGKPAIGEAFVIVRFDNTAPTTSATFPADTANGKNTASLSTKSKTATTKTDC